MVVDRGVSWEGALKLYHQHMSDYELLVTPGSGSGVGSGFFCSKREQYHRHLYLLALQKASSTHLFNIVRYEIHGN